uniref:Uncharacterized protein n=1 Tax=Tetraselmis chuii TaxID=63592 RepID=A0A6U1FGQ7_9CHLO
MTEDAQDRVRAMMRAETAEAQCTALSEELMDSTRRYAREISSLKAQLAEKDAQLMGGFGSLSNLMLGGDLNSTSLAPVRPVSNPLRNSLQTTGKAQSNASPIVDHQLSPTGVPSHRESSPAGLGSNSLNRHQPLGSTRNGSGDVSRSVPHTPTGNHQTPINPSISNRVLAPLNTHGGPATPPKRGASPSSSPRQPALPLSSSPRGYPRLNADALLAHPRGSSLGPSETEPGGRPASRGSTRLSASRPPLSPTAAARGLRSVDPGLIGSPQAGQQRREITRERRPSRTGITGGRPLGSGAPRSDAHHRLQSSRPPNNPTHPKQPHSSAKTPQYSGRAYHSQRSFSTVSDEEMGAAAERMLSLAKTDDFLDSHRGLLGTSDSEYSDEDDNAYSDDEDDYSSDDGEQAVEPSRPHYLAAAAPRVAAT